jgi:ribonucleotide reductase alpha subunit
MFRTQFSEDIFNHKYRHEGAETWEELATTLVTQVCSKYMSLGDMSQLVAYISDMKFIPGGRYLYYAGRPNPFFNNCYLLRSEEDSREDWADLSWKSESCLMTGGGIGNDYSRYRPAGAPIKRTGGTASGPLPKMEMINEIGRRVMQGGSRRSAIYASLNWQHADAEKFLTIKDWDQYPVPGTNLTLKDLKALDFNWPCPLDTTNISLNYDDDWLQLADRGQNKTFLTNVRQALRSSEPGFAFNFGKHANETLRNAPVAGDTWVMTEDGYTQVRDILDIATVLWTGKQWAEATFTRTAEMVPTLQINMSGGRVITADPTHEFLVERYAGAGVNRRLLRIDKVAAADLEEGNTLHVSLPDLQSEGLDLDGYRRGLAFGDGSFSRRQPSRVDLTLCTDDKKACFDRVRTLEYVSINENDSRGYVRAYFHDYWFIGKSKDQFPQVADHELASFLAGLFDTDGSYDLSRQSIRLGCVHKPFLEGVRRALETLGIQSSITTGGLSGYNQRQGYTLCVLSNSVQLFGDLIPTTRLRIKAEGYKPYRASQIKVISIEPGPTQDVFCCDVGVDEHTFCADGVIISNCTEVTSEDDSDVCNLGSLNMGRIENLEELRDVIRLSTMFLICGTLTAKLPYAKVYDVREKNRRLGLGLMGVHEGLIKRGSRYEVTPELHSWLRTYRDDSDSVSRSFAEALGVSTPIANRAIAPTGTIGILAGTTTGIEPLFAVVRGRRHRQGADRTLRRRPRQDRKRHRPGPGLRTPHRVPGRRPGLRGHGDQLDHQPPRLGFRAQQRGHRVRLRRHAGPLRSSSSWLHCLRRRLARWSAPDTRPLH